MIKIAIVAATILFFGTMMTQEVYAPDILNAKAIPPWVDNVMGFYLSGDISERELLDAFDFMFKNNIMHMSQEAAQQVAELREENKKLHQQLTQYRESDLDFAQRMQDGQAMHQMEPDSWDGSDDPTRFDQAQMTTQGEEIHTDEYGRVKVQFPWMSSDESIKQHIAEMKKSIDSLPPERQQTAISSLRTLVTTQAMSTTSGAGGDITMQGGSGSGTGDATDYDRLTMKADLDEHEGTISKFLVLQKELETIEADIEALTEKIDSSISQQKTIRKDVILLQDASSKGVFPTKVLLSDGVIVIESARDADVLVKKWEEQLSSAGDDAQLANIDLQNALQKQQQTLQTMSNVSKMLHDTAMSIIRKIG